MAVIVFIKYPVSKREEEILLVSQYRPPVASEVRRAACTASRVDYVALPSGFPCITMLLLLFYAAALDTFSRRGLSFVHVAPSLPGRAYACLRVWSTLDSSFSEGKATTFPVSNRLEWRVVGHIVAKASLVPKPYRP